MGKRAKRMVNEALKAALDPIQPPQNMGVALAMDACAKEVERRPTPQERRAKLVAAHVALEGIARHMNFPDWQALETVRRSILASIGELEMRG